MYILKNADPIVQVGYHTKKWTTKKIADPIVLKFEQCVKKMQTEKQTKLILNRVLLD